MFSRIRVTGFVSALVMAAVLSVACDTPANAADSVNLTEIAAKLKTYFDSLESIEIEYTQTPIGGEYQAVSQWRWMRSGPRKLLSLNSEPGGTGIKVPHGWWSFDGEDAYSVIVDLDVPTQIKQIYRTETIDQMYEDIPNPLHFLGHPLQGSQETLVNLLPRSTITGSEQIGAIECLRIELPSVKSVDSEQAVTFWLDPSEGYLPRRYFQRDPGLKEVSEATSKHSFFICDFDEFMNVKDELLGEVRRFPKTGRITGPGGVHRYDFTKVRMNHQPERSRFMPQAQVGAEMIVRRAGQPEVMTVYGGREGVARRQEQNLNLVKKMTEERQAEAQQATKETPVDARPPTSSWFWIGSSVLCAVLLVGLIWWARTHG